MDILIGLLGVIFAIAVAYLFSNQKKNINYKAIGVLLVLQVIVTLFMLKTTIGTKIIEAVSNGVSKVISYGYEGIDFVVGGLIPEGVSVFFFNVLMVIIFTSTLLSILTYIKF